MRMTSEKGTNLKRLSCEPASERNKLKSLREESLLWILNGKGRRSPSSRSEKEIDGMIDDHQQQQ